MPKEKPQFYTTRQTAEALNISYITAFRKVASKEFPSIRLGKKILIPVAFIDNLVIKALSEVQPQGAA